MLHLDALKDLYQRYGGEKYFRPMLRDFYHRMSNDLMIGFFFIGKDTDQIADRQLGFIQKALGIDKSFVGKAPVDAHDELPPILAGHFDRRIVLLRETLITHGMSLEDADAYVRFELAFRGPILKQSGKTS